MTTITQPKIQKLETLEDLALLLRGDVVQIECNGEQLKAFYCGSIGSFYDFAVRDVDLKDGRKSIRHLAVNRANNASDISIEDGNIRIRKKILDKSYWPSEQNYYFFNTALMEAGI